jgi:radical SAM protein with 4Fe4S-binding SPASM domain
MNEIGIVLGQPYIEIVSQCNLSCVYCYHEQKTNDILLFQTIEELCHDLKELNVTNIKISGGEPMLHPDILKILKMINHYNLKIELVTNGTLFDEENIVSIIAFVDKLIISFDSFDREIEEFTRPDSYDKVFRTIKLLSQKNTDFIKTHVYIGAVMTKVNKEFNDLIEFCEKNTIAGIIFELIHREGKAKNIFKNITLDYEEYNELRKLQLDFRNKVNVEISPLPDLGGGCMLINDPAIVRARIDSQGYVYPCRSFLNKEISIGNIYLSSIKDILNGYKTKEFINLLRERENKIDRCNKCFLKNVSCKCGCAAQSYNRTGKLCDVDDLCNWRIQQAFGEIKKLLGNKNEDMYKCI